MDGVTFDRIDRRLTGTAAGRTAVLGDAAGQLLPDDTVLFVQTAASGTFTPQPGACTPTASGGGDYLLTLWGHPGGTVYVSDHATTIFGAAPTERFLAGLGFAPDNPPNAALVTQAADGDAIVVLELVDPRYDADAGTLTYGASVLTEYAGAGLAHVANRLHDAALPEAFGRASLFIDDCPDIVHCYHELSSVGSVPGGPIGTCWSWSDLTCLPCNGQSISDLDLLCDRTFPDACDRRCYVLVA